MVITDELFAAFIRCKTKSYLTATAIKIDQNEALDFQRRVLQNYNEKSRRYLATKVFKGHFAGNISPEIPSSKQYSLIFDCALGTEKIQSRFHALQLSSAANGKPQGYIPVRFVPAEKIDKYEKLQLAFDALVISMYSVTCQILGI